MKGRDSHFFKTLDFLWDCALRPHTPQEFLDELEGLEKGGRMKNTTDLSLKARRVIAASNLPADVWNIEILGNLWNDGVSGCSPNPFWWLMSAHAVSSVLVASELALHAKNTTCAAQGREALLGIQSHPLKATPPLPPGHCDFFAAWGPATEGGRLISSRNLDITPATGISKNKVCLSA